MQIKRGELLKAEDWQFQYCQKANPDSNNLSILSYGSFRIKPGVKTDHLMHHKQESMLFCMNGTVTVDVEGESFTLTHYDTLYIPSDAPYCFENKSSDEAFLLSCRAKAENKYKPMYSSWKEVSADKSRIRKLKGKDVFIMFDVTDEADSLVAGYTIYEPYTRAWPAHNHTDQEEIYIFTKGKGSMEVYENEESKHFVHNVDCMDAVSIPFMNYHPVFSQEEELHFIWCIAGERYWVGDKNTDFMKGDCGEMTT